MQRRFRGLYARALCHTTEDIEKVKTAVTNTVGPCDLVVRNTEGVHGNPISIVEAAILDQEHIEEFISRISVVDIYELLHTLEKRIDEGCNFFLKIDKQSAFLGHTRLGNGDDVISVRIRMSSYPATCDAAKSLVRDALAGELARRGENADS